MCVVCLVLIHFGLLEAVSYVSTYSLKSGRRWFFGSNVSDCIDPHPLLSADIAHFSFSSLGEEKNFLDYGSLAPGERYGIC